MILPATSGYSPVHVADRYFRCFQGAASKTGPVHFMPFKILLAKLD